MDVEVFIAKSDEEIASCFPAFYELRPHLKSENLLPQIRRQEQQSYQILALRHGDFIKSVAGFRQCEFLAWGKIVYIDDLSTISEARGNGFAGILLDWLIDYAKSNGCEGVHLDSGYSRNDAHRLYLQKGFILSSHHFTLKF